MQKHRMVFNTYEPDEVDTLVAKLRQAIREEAGHDAECNKMMSWHHAGLGIFEPAQGDDVKNFQPCSCWIAEALR